MININSLERDGLRQAELCPRNTMMKNNYRFEKITLFHCMIGCFGRNGHLKQYFSLYRVDSQREGERRQK